MKLSGCYHFLKTGPFFLALSTKQFWTFQQNGDFQFLRIL